MRRRSNASFLFAPHFLVHFDYNELMKKELTAASFLSDLKSIVPPNGKVPMGNIFALAKSYMGMPLTEIKALLELASHEARVGTVSIMDARDKKTSTERKKELYNLYIQAHDYIDTWDLVDRAAPYVLGDIWLTNQGTHYIS